MKNYANIFWFIFDLQLVFIWFLRVLTTYVCICYLIFKWSTMIKWKPIAIGLDLVIWSFGQKLLGNHSHSLFIVFFNQLGGYIKLLSGQYGRAPQFGRQVGGEEEMITNLILLCQMCFLFSILQGVFKEKVFKWI